MVAFFPDSRTTSLRLALGLINLHGQSPLRYGPLPLHLFGRMRVQAVRLAPDNSATAARMAALIAASPKRFPTHRQWVPPGDSGSSSRPMLRSPPSPPNHPSRPPPPQIS